MKKNVVKESKSTVQIYLQLQLLWYLPGKQATRLTTKCTQPFFILVN